MKLLKHVFAFVLAFVVVGISASTTYAWHDKFAANTNNCDYCHSLHASDEKMLLVDNGSEACISCHDGTSKSRSVEGHLSNAGTMSALDNYGVGGTDDRSDATKEAASASASAHDINAGKKVNSAPGGNNGSTTGGWGSSFSCISCHTGHRSTDRAEKIAMIRTNIIDTSVDTKAVNLGNFTGTAKVYAEVPAAGNSSLVKDAQYILVKTQALNAPYTKNGRTYYGAFYNNQLSKAGSTYATVGMTDSDYVLYPYIWVNSMNSYKPVTPKITVSDAAAFGTNLKVAPEGYLYSETKDYVKNLAAATAVSGLKYEFTVDPVKGDNHSYWNSLSTSYKFGNGNELTLFCIQCHADYMSSSYSHKNVTYGEEAKNRHRTLEDRLSCTRCHFAHGTDYQMIRDANGFGYFDFVDEKTGELIPGKTYLDGQGASKTFASVAAVKTYFTDANKGGSALKRQVGYGSCLECHASAVGNVPATGVPVTKKF